MGTGGSSLRLMPSRPAMSRAENARYGSADVVPCGFREQRIAVFIVEQRLICFPERLMYVHAGAVVTEEGLGHEGGRETEIMAHVLNDVLVRQEPIGRLHECSEAEVDLCLSRGCHLMMLHFDRNAGFDERQHDLRSHILQPVCGRHREVALLVTRPVPQVRHTVPP